MTESTNVSINLQSPNISTVVYAVQNDRTARHIVAQLRDGSSPWTPPVGAAPIIRYVKPDGTGGFYDADDNNNPAVTITGSVADLTLVEQTLTVPGDVYMQLHFYAADGTRLTSFSWILRVQQSVLNDATIVSSDYFNVLTAKVSQAVQAASDAAESAAEAAASAASISIPLPITSGGTDATTAGEAFSNLGGIRPNLLDNWYFVGGGSQQGAGYFPINSHGQTSYSGSGYHLDRWQSNYSGTTIALYSDFVAVRTSDNFRQTISGNELAGKTVTFSALLRPLSSGPMRIGYGSNVVSSIPLTAQNDFVLYSLTATIPSAAVNVWTDISSTNNNMNFNIKAIKLEIGDTQTLAHQESGVWVLNEVPNYYLSLAAENNIETSKSFSVDCTTAATGVSGWYCGQLQLTSSDIGNARAVIPLYARKAGYNYPITVAYENGYLRVFGPASLSVVDVGVALIY